MCVLSPLAAFSQHRGRGGHDGRSSWDLRYRHPRGYHWYNNSWWLGDVMVGGLVIGATIASLPPSYRVIYVDRAPYYYNGVYYYRATPSGYVVVNPVAIPVIVTPAQPAPVVVQPQVQSSGTITLNVPNSKGDYTPVQLTKYQDGYLGPQGEYYPGNPTVDQLKALHGQ